ASGGSGTWTDIAGSGALATVLGALRGALEGAVSSTWRGTRAARDSWIGAAAGAGAGMIAGTVMGIKKAPQAQAVYPVAYQTRMVQAPSPIAPALLTDFGIQDAGPRGPAYSGPPWQP